MLMIQCSHPVASVVVRLWLLLLVVVISVTVVQHDVERCRVCAETVADRSQKLMCGICSGVVDACFNTRIVLLSRYLAINSLTTDE